MSLEPVGLAEYILLSRAVLPFDGPRGIDHQYVRLVREGFPAIGTGEKVPSVIEFESRDVSRKSIIALRDIGEGEVITDDMLAVKRPGTGIPPTRVGEVIGQVAVEDIPAGTMMTLEMLGGVPA